MVEFANKIGGAKKQYVPAVGEYRVYVATDVNGDGKFEEFVDNVRLFNALTNKWKNISSSFWKDTDDKTIHRQLAQNTKFAFPIFAGCASHGDVTIEDDDSGDDVVDDDSEGNHAPVFDPIGDKNVSEREELSFTVLATDQDGDELTYSASGLPVGASFNVSTGIFSWTPACNQAGEYNIKFAVADNKTPNLTASQGITITVNDACPNVAWTFSGGFSGEGTGIATDNSGNVYVTGYVSGDESDDVWVRKYDTNSNIIWTETYNDSANNADGGGGIVVDSARNVYVTGTESILREGDYLAMRDIWLRKYDTNGNTIWTETYVGSTPSEGYGVAVDNVGNVYVTGYEIVDGESYNILVRKYDFSGNTLWTDSYNGPANDVDEGKDIAVDNVGNVYVTGYERVYHVDGEGYNIWVRKYDTNGNTLWTETYDGPANSSDSGRGIAVDDDGNVYVTGREDAFHGNNGFIWVRKYDTNGNTIWTEGGIVGGAGNGIAVDDAGSVYVVGYMDDVSSGTIGEMKNIWIRKYDTDGNTIWTDSYNGPTNGVDEGKDIAIDNVGNVYVTGNETVDYGAFYGYNIWIRKYTP